jgi:hypothetical protein
VRDVLGGLDVDGWRRHRVSVRAGRVSGSPGSFVRAECPSPLSTAPGQADALGVDQSVTQMPKGPYREVLDWLLEQIERLDGHNSQLLAEAERGEVDLATIASRRAAIRQAQDWLAEQLRLALVARGMRDAA